MTALRSASLLRHPPSRASPRAPSDIRYCAAMAKAYSSLFPRRRDGGVRRRPPEPRRYRTQATIAALEHKLKDKKIDLPSDGTVTHPGFKLQSA